MYTFITEGQVEEHIEIQKPTLVKDLPGFLVAGQLGLQDQQMLVKLMHGAGMKGEEKMYCGDGFLRLLPVSTCTSCGSQND